MTREEVKELTKTIDHLEHEKKNLEGVRDSADTMIDFIDVKLSKARAKILVNKWTPKERVRDIEDF